MTVKARPQKGEKSRQILDVSRALFAQLGFAAVSVDEIARIANVSKPTIYSHFGSKEGLFLSILDDSFTKISAPLIGTEVSGLSIGEVLLSHAKSYSRTLLEPDILALNRLMIAEGARFPDMARRYYQSGPELVYKAVADFLQKRVALGEIQCDDCHIAARIYGGMIISSPRIRLHLQVERRPNWKDIDQYVTTAVNIFLNGLLPKP